MEDIVDALLEERESLTLKLKSRATLSRRRVISKDTAGRIPEPKERSVSFPGATAQEAWNFS